LLNSAYFIHYILWKPECFNFSWAGKHHPR
jgi:hypothetical protein